MKTYAVLSMAVLVSLTACKPRAHLTFHMDNGAELKGEGITFLVPTESGSSSAGSGGIKYEGESVKAETDGKTLTVNGTSYGSVKAGDTVDLKDKGKVLVNGVVRSPATP